MMHFEDKNLVSKCWKFYAEIRSILREIACLFVGVPTAVRTEMYERMFTVMFGTGAGSRFRCPTREGF